MLQRPFLSKTILEDSTRAAVDGYEQTLQTDGWDWQDSRDWRLETEREAGGGMTAGLPWSCCDCAHPYPEALPHIQDHSVRSTGQSKRRIPNDLSLPWSHKAAQTAYCYASARFDSKWLDLRHDDAPQSRGSCAHSVSSPYTPARRSSEAHEARARWDLARLKSRIEKRAALG